MGYLVCKKCDGFYELRDNEYPEDFELCQCGGNLKYVLYLDEDIDRKLNHYNNTKICSKCKKDNIKTAKICVFCGHNFNETKKSTSLTTLRVTAIFIGILIVIIPSIFFSTPYWIMIIIGSFITSVISSKNEKKGIMDGAITGLMASLILFAYKNNAYDMLTGFILIPIIFGVIGGLTAVLIKNRIKTNRTY